MQLEFTKTNATLLSGAAVAAVLGIMLGGAMRPQLVFDGRPMGPQMFAAGGGARSTGPFDPGAAYASYRGAIPEYVIGTDATQTAYVEAPQIAEERAQPARYEETETPEPVTLTRATYEEPPLPQVVYPSMAGGRSYDAETSAPPAPPEDEPPTVTG